MMLKALLATFLLSTSVYAADEVKSVTPSTQEAGYNFAGVSLGVAKPAGTNINSVPLRFAYGLDFTHAFTKELALGAFVSRNDGEAAKGSIIDLTITRVGAQVLYSPTADSILSLKAGIGFVEYSANLNGANLKFTPDTNPIFVAPGLGIIFPITDKIQFIPNISYTFFLENDDIESFQVFDAMGSLRYQF